PEFIDMDGYGRNKPPHDPLHFIFRNAPNTKETQDMIDAKRIKVIAHLAESLFPPGKSIFLHSLPVINRESPVLPDDREIIRRSPGLPVHVQKLRSHPCITAIAINTDWNISFQNDPILVRIICRFFQLQMKMILYEIIKTNLFK